MSVFEGQCDKTLPKNVILKGTEKMLTSENIIVKIRQISTFHWEHYVTILLFKF